MLPTLLITSLTLFFTFVQGQVQLQNASVISVSEVTQTSLIVFRTSSPSASSTRTTRIPIPLNAGQNTVPTTSAKVSDVDINSGLDSSTTGASGTTTGVVSGGGRRVETVGSVLGLLLGMGGVGLFVETVGGMWI